MTIKMSLDLFNFVPAGAIECISDEINKPFFKRADLGRFLGIVDIRHVYKNIATKSRYELNCCVPSRAGMLGGRKNLHDAFIDLEGVLEILARSQKPKAVELLRKMGSTIHQYKYVRKETETISYVTRAFKGEEMIDQYHVDGYRIDLYFPVHKLAVECDEFDHRDRDIEYEVKRQKHIEDKLKCHFIRYNPDADDFDPFHLINRIYRHMKSC